MVRIGFGCVKLGSGSSGHSWRADVRLVRDAVEQGVTLFDTADAYGSGASELVLGKALAGRRHGITVATKGGYRFRPRTLAEQSARRLVAGAARRLRRPGDGDGQGGGAYAEQDFSRAGVRAAVEASLRRLRTDHIDVYQLHGPHEVLPELLASLGDLVRTGKVGRFGIGAESVGEAAAWLAVDEVGVVQVPFGLLDPEAADDVFPAATGRGVEVWARGVLGGGLLGEAMSGSPAIRSDPKWPLIERLQALATEHGIGLDRLAVGYAQSFPQLGTMLLGISSTGHLRRALDLAAAGPLEPELLAAVGPVLRQWAGAGG
jgi:aryl-alcohol dehydrogenase-like predicted oxidoreductase